MAEIVDTCSEIERVLSLVTARNPRAFEDYESMMSLHGKKSVEYKANLGAVKLLVPFYCQEIHKENVNVCDFQHTYDIPSYLSSVVREQVKQYYVNK